MLVEFKGEPIPKKQATKQKTEWRFHMVPPTDMEDPARLANVRGSLVELEVAPAHPGV